MPEEAPDPVRALLTEAARQILESLHPLPAQTAPVVVKVEGLDALVTITVVPGGVRAVSRLSPCERDCLAVLSRAGRRLTGTEIMDALARHGLRWSQVTVWRSLARLHKRGYVDNSKTAPQGYVLIACPPLPFTA